MNIFHRIKRKISNSPYFYQWSIRVNFSDSVSKHFPDFTNLVPPKDRFWADPFVLKRNEKYFIFIEEMQYSNNFGHISVIELDEDGKYTKPIKIIEKNYHLSYPFLFEFQKKIYLIHGSVDKSESFVELFECVDFPYKWVSHKKILENVPLVDTTIFYQSGKWWLFGCQAESDGTSKSEKLLLFYTDDPVNKVWNAHPLNPVISDVSKARPAGKIFKMDGRIIRPGQNCNKVYGRGFSLNHITKLNEAEYSEEQLEYFEPTWDDSLIGLHTFNFDGKCTVIDTRGRRSRLN